MSDYTTKTASLKTSIANISIADTGKLISRKGIDVTGGNVVISDGVLTFDDLTDGTTKVNINKTGITTPKLVSDSIQDSSGYAYLTKDAADELYGNQDNLVGEIKWYAGSSVPNGYLLCNGSTISRTTYAKLFAAIGTTWGTGNGSTTFTLPNLINRVPWGASTAGNYKAAGLPNITGTLGGIKCRNSSGASGFSTYSGAFTKNTTNTEIGYWSSTMADTSAANVVNFNASSSNSIYGNSSTVQPPAATLMPIIKY